MQFIDLSLSLPELSLKLYYKKKIFVFKEAKQIWPQVSVTDKFKFASHSWCLSKANKAEAKHNKCLQKDYLIVSLKTTADGQQYNHSLWSILIHESLFLFIQGWQYVECSETWPQMQPFYLHRFLRDAKVVGTTESWEGTAATAVLAKINVPSRGTSLTLGQTLFS